MATWLNSRVLMKTKTISDWIICDNIGWMIAIKIKRQQKFTFRTIKMHSIKDSSTKLTLITWMNNCRMQFWKKRSQWSKQKILIILNPKGHNINIISDLSVGCATVGLLRVLVLKSQSPSFKHSKLWKPNGKISLNKAKLKMYTFTCKIMIISHYSWRCIKTLKRHSKIWL